MEKEKKITTPTTKKSGISTREAIIKSTTDTINKIGVIDFRIEMISTSLGLSPGNITYHFPRKEDIITAIWDEYNQSVSDSFVKQINNPLLDIKQLFLICRASAFTGEKYIGVKSYFNGDVGNLKRMWEYNDKQVKLMRESLYQSYEVLHQNGYMIQIPNDTLRELLFLTQFAIMRWWYNLAMIDGGVANLKLQIDSYVIKVIYPLEPYLTERGLEQLESVKKSIKKKPKGRVRPEL